MLEVIVNKYSPLIVKNQKGEILYEWNPLKDIVITAEDIDKYPTWLIQNYINNKN